MELARVALPSFPSVLQDQFFGLQRTVWEQEITLPYDIRKIFL